MRYQRGHKDQTREKIVRAASERFRRNGAAGVAISEIMQELRLTHGGFYRHFKSKEDLFKEALTRAIAETEDFFREATKNAPEGQELRAIIEAYLSVEHCLDVPGGCPIAALAAEVRRQPKSVRMAFDRALKDHISRAARYMPGESVKREQTAAVLFSGMVGTLTMARALSDPARRDRLLKSSREMYIHMFCNA